MPIGHHVKKYQAEKAARERAQETDIVIETPESVTPGNTSVTQSDLLAAMKLLIDGIRSAEMPAESKERLALEAERLALEQERVKREMPENKQAPGISVYSYPEGELAHPKPPLKCKFYWCGPEEHVETLTPEEVELRNRLEPGDYFVTKADGTKIPFKVEGKRNNDGRLESLVVWYPCKDEHRHNHMPNTAYLRQALGEHVPSNDELLQQVHRLQAELASARSATVGA